jgi:hypothetical protein
MPRVGSSLVLVCAAVGGLACSGCVGHRFSPAISPTTAPTPTFDAIDGAMSVGLRQDGMTLLEASAAFRVAPRGEIRRFLGADAAAPDPRPRDLLSDLLIAIDLSGLMSLGASDALPLGTLGLRVGYLSDWLAADLGIAWTSFTFVVGASFGPRFEAPIGSVVKLRGELDLYGSAPLDSEMGYSSSPDSFFFDTSGPPVRATAGVRARLGLGLALAGGVELRVGLMAGAAANGRDPTLLEASAVVGLGGSFGYPSRDPFPAYVPGTP